MKLGVCYYPEHWPQTLWRDDARRMADLGLSLVRIGEFAWSRIEPSPGSFDWDWLDESIEILHGAGLSVVLGTPTATPPKWLIDRSPEILAHDAHGHPRRFGSRRHYCFSSPVYRHECARIVDLMARRYGAHPAVSAWQTDNEFGCHDTVLSYSPAAIAAFRLWLQHTYADITSLNEAWGTVFWSQEYRGFEEIDAPAATVTEPHPAHVMDFKRFSSDQVLSFNRLQADIIRDLSPARDIIHNFMGYFTDFNHFEMGRDLDVAAWDSYPLGMLETGWSPPEEKNRWLRQGHPDFAAYHHDLYRGCGRGRMWVMEQQPGPVNWAQFNPSPLVGMVRLWTWEAFAHGAEVVSYFRWRQVPFAQEQMHAGLLAPDSLEDQAAVEARQVRSEIGRIGTLKPKRGDVALIYDYEGHWACSTQPHARTFRHNHLAFEFYKAARRLGLDIDSLPPDGDLSGYKMIIVPSLPIVDTAFVETLENTDAHILIGPRTGSRTPDMKIPDDLAPGPLQDLIPLQVRRVETLRDGFTEPGSFEDTRFHVKIWREFVRSDLTPKASTDDGHGVWFAHNRLHYLAAWPCESLLDNILRNLAEDAGLSTLALPCDVRVRRTDAHMFVFNYGTEAVDLTTIPGWPVDASYRLGSPRLPAADLAVLDRG